MKRVVILEAQLKRYRVPFVRQLAAALREHDISLVVGYSAPSPQDRERADTVELDRELGQELPVAAFAHGRIVVQPAWHLVREADLVIIGQANGLLFNYVVLALSLLGLKRVAYWGHGYNHQAHGRGVSEWIKRKLLGRVDWWFAYAPEVSAYLVRHGVRAETITTVYNTIDTGALRSAIVDVDRGRARASLGIAPGSPVAIYCGALVPEKQLGFIVDAAAEVRRLIPDFELVIVGAGCERAMLEALVRYRPFLHVVGPLFEADRASSFAISDICMLPAYAGLAVIDAFAAGLPIATTDHPGHGPELGYLTPGVDSIVTEFDVDRYAWAIADLLARPADLAAMKAAARRAADRVPMQRMVAAFTEGIVRCLESP